MSRPVIGVIAEFTDIEIHGTTMPANVATLPYLKSVTKAGGVPVVFPITTDRAAVIDLVDRVDGLVLTGGVDIDPAAYGAERDPRTGDTQPERDEFETLLVTRLVEVNKPTLAICRGVQSMNVALGGDLIQHVEGHMRSDAASEQVHAVEVEGGSCLASVVGSGRVEVNSLHHQAIGVLGARCVAVARNEDGHVEGIEVEGADRVLGVQWHPELLRHLPSQLALFEKVVADAATFSTTR